MTRFARSKGSKSSNERIPEAPTPWNIMQGQLQDKMKNSKDSAKRAEFEAMRKENYEKFLKEEKEKGITKSWCEFEDESNPNKKGEPTVNDTKMDETATAKLSKNQLKKLKRKSALSSTTDKPIPTDNVVTKKKSKSSQSPKVEKPKDSDNESVLNEDDPEFLKWCDEPFDKETQNQYDDLKAKLDKLCEKEEQGVGAENDSGKNKNKKANRKRKLKDEDIVATTDAPPILNDDDIDSKSIDPPNEALSENQIDQKTKKSKKAKKNIQIDESQKEQSNLTPPEETPAKKKKRKINKVIMHRQIKLQPLTQMILQPQTQMILQPQTQMILQPQTRIINQIQRIKNTPGVNR